MEVTYIMVADAANKTADGKINILGGYNAIGSTQAPVVVPNLTLIFGTRYLTGERGGRFSFQIVLLDEDGGIAWRTEGLSMGVANTPNLTPRDDIIFNIQGLVFPKYGRYRFDILMNNDIKGQFVIDITHIPQIGPQPPGVN